jgi:hypothetical protein
MLFKNLLGKMALGRKLLKGETGEQVLKGLDNYNGFRIDKKKINAIIAGGVIIILGIALLTGKITFEEFQQGVEGAK